MSRKWKDEEHASKEMEAYIKSLEKAKTDVEKLTEDDDIGILMLVFGLAGQGKSIFAATVSSYGKTFFIDLTRESRTLKQYAKYFPDLEICTIYEKDEFGKFHPGKTFEKLSSELDKAIASEKYECIVIDGYTFVIKWANQYLRWKIGLEPETLNPIGEVPWANWSWRDDKYINIQGALQDAADNGLKIVCTGEAKKHSKLVKDPSTDKLIKVENKDIKPKLKNDLSDEFMFDLISKIEYIGNKRIMTFIKSKIAGIEVGKSQITNPSFKKVMMLRKPGALEF